MTLEEIANKLRYTIYDTPEQLAEDLADMLDAFSKMERVALKNIKVALGLETKEPEDASPI